ncbi:MAG: hypothetical protein ACFB0G_09950 [Leptolyngbyaceae cyanobacterium]
MQSTAASLRVISLLISTGLLSACMSNQASNPNEVILPADFQVPTVNDFTGAPGCYIAAYSQDAQQGVYAVGEGVYLMGQLRVPGTYQGSICQPTGYEDQDISAENIFKELFDEKLSPACSNRSCWAGGDTGGFVGAN